MNSDYGFVDRRREAIGGPSVWLPTTVIVLALLALLLVPVLVQRSVGEARDEIQHAADPARTAVTRLQYLLARQTSSLRGFFISGDTTFLEQYREFTTEEEEIHAQLAPLARRLGSETLEHFVALRTLSSQWHGEVGDELRAGRGDSIAAIPFEMELYLQALRVANSLDDAVVDATRQRRDRIVEAERRAEWLQAGLGLLTLLATLSAAGLSRRVRRLANEAEERRQQAERALGETARAVDSKTRLIRGVTHDVKNPLGAADGYAELLEMGLHGDLTPQQAQVVAGIRRSIRGAIDIVQDLLELSFAEAGNLQIERRPARLGELVHAVVDDYRGSADASAHALEVLPCEADPVAITDEAKVRQILGNLIGNAIKYTPRGGWIGVAVGTDVSGAPRAGRWAAVRVSDSGPGIPPEDRERIFEEFHRLPGSEAEGHGLGLTISRRIARLLDGDITVEGELGRGSTFVLWLPAEESATGAHQPQVRAH